MNERGRPVEPRPGRWLARVAPARARGTVNVALVSDARVRALNRQYRGKDSATDVLSFAADHAAGGTGGSRRKGRNGRGRPIPPVLPIQPILPLLGDIVIARGVAKRQAWEARHDELTELRVLALHGLLHLLGYDHERDNGDMRRVERRLLRKGGLRESLIERTST